MAEKPQAEGDIAGTAFSRTAAKPSALDIELAAHWNPPNPKQPPGAPE